MAILLPATDRRRPSSWRFEHRARGGRCGRNESGPVGGGHQEGRDVKPSLARRHAAPGERTGRAERPSAQIATAKPAGWHSQRAVASTPQPTRPRAFLRLPTVLRVPLPHLTSLVQPPTVSARFRMPSGARWRDCRARTRAVSHCSLSSTLLRKHPRIQRSLIRSYYRCLDPSVRHLAAPLALHDAGRDGQLHEPLW